MEMAHIILVGSLGFLFILAANDLILISGAFAHSKMLLNFSGNLNGLLILIFLFDIVFESYYPIGLLTYIAGRIFVSYLVLKAAEGAGKKAIKEETIPINAKGQFIA